jgi:hypothetical protein
MVVVCKCSLFSLINVCTPFVGNSKTYVAIPTSYVILYHISRNDASLQTVLVVQNGVFTPESIMDLDIYKNRCLSHADFTS